MRTLGVTSGVSGFCGTMSRSLCLTELRSNRIGIRTESVMIDLRQE